LIVATTSSVTIYDMDDPAVPMWMVFNEVFSGRPLISSASGRPSSVSALNGVLCIGLKIGTVNDGQAGIGVVNFVSETITKTNTNAGNGNRNIGPLIDRNIGKDSDGVYPYGGPIADNTVNDVAITALPGARIDDQTGLPVPTIAVGTDGGVSVIKDDGTVFDAVYSSNLQAEKVRFLPNDRMTIALEKDVALWLVGDIPSADVTTNDPGAVLANGYALYVNTTQDLTYLNALNLTETKLAALSDGIAAGTSYGLSQLAENITTPTNGMVAYTTSDYSTGWMHGDVKGAFLCEASEDDLVGGELVTNGTFDTDTTGWGSIAGATLSVDTQRLKVENGGTPSGIATQSIPTTAGLTYVLSVDFAGGTTDGQVRIGSTQGAFNIDVVTTGGTTAKQIVITFVATQASMWLGFFSNEANLFTLWDNISVKLANEDRSVNGNGLAVNGTITVAPVETGAETMAYSGFSSTNYLEQPYNSDLDFGTGDFYVMGWVKGTDTDGKIIIRRTASLSDDRIALDVSASLYRFYVDTGSNLITSTASATTGVWTFVCGIRKSGVLFLYVDGALQGTGINASDLSNSDAVLNIGQHPTLNDPYGGSLSRWRIGAGAPTPEQIRKIYRDELPLYREDAACTINGTSSAVTALSSDPVTGLLQVGTSGGLSAFRGLQRVEQDTTAVTTTISANGATVARQ